MDAEASRQEFGLISNLNIDTVAANIFEVFCSPGEVILAFGTIQTPNCGQDDLMQASLDRRIMLSPYIAKKLAALLNNKVREYESVFGTLSHEVQSTFSPVNNSSPPDTPVFASREIAGKAHALVRLVDSLGVDYGMERSFKISDKSLLSNRVIMGLKKSDLTGDPDETLCSVFTRMGMPPNFMDECRKLLPTTEFVHFGFEEQRDGCLYKAYLEFRTNLKFAPGGAKVTQEPFLVFLGFKWDPFNNNKGAKTSYTCYPLLSVDEIQERLSNLFERNPDYKSFETAKNILQNAVKIISNDKIVYEEVSEESNPRKSFDMNLYGAELCIRDIYPFLMDIGRHYALPADQFIPLCDRISDKRFGHLSGGIDREGKDFLTVYYGVESVDTPRRPVDVQ